ncbi:hypothetical protein IMZ38_00615 [Thermosphaera chiliense]|uniref:Uncharacterized protein n=1 Tax=Thermosphaera chiliense TaxID=3402707 RepID=A0A7M1UQG8_9CREN|nr:hypothetical protein [Thermosphaera aggregans]QOR94490.1 hypothetical protein IMZ38_00615 [Thermosphaera aggregans]
MRVFESIYGLKYRVEILHLPFDVEYFHSDRRDALIVAGSRFSLEEGLKNILTVVEKLPDYKLYIVGSATRVSRKVLD